MFVYRQFDVKASRNVPLRYLRWPRREEANDGAGLGGNRQYMDLRGRSWSEASLIAIED
jgi:hypothetical protein